MLKLLTNLKQTFWSVVLIVILLCIQASADLALPDYTSKIVNVGIQAGGIENPVPKIISKENMDLILMLSEDDEKITNNYSLVGSTLTADEEKIVKKYLGKDYKVEANELYILNDIEEDKMSELSSVLSVPLLSLIHI